MNQTVSTVRCSEASSLGVAMLQAVATGRYENLNAAAEGMVQYDSIVEPNSEGARVYDDRYRTYIETRNAYMKRED
jgi:ribulose kinase